jgi:hypothetical protein
MKRWKTWVAVATLAAGATTVVACSDDESDGAGASRLTGDGGTTEEGGAGEGSTPALSGSASEFCDSTLGVVGRALEGCCTVSDQAARDYTIAHGLVAAFQPQCTSTLGASIAKGRVAFHADQATACYGAYATTYAPGKCANITQTYTSPAGAACRLVFSGMGADGAACAGSHECKDGLACVGYTKDADGTCHAPGAIGDACGAMRVDGGSDITFSLDLDLGEHPACVAGARCESAVAKCVAAAPAGNSCVRDEDCASPLLCHLYVCGATGPAAEGGACKTEDDCVKGLYCDRPTNDDGVCATKKPAGGSCTGSDFGTPECIGRCDADAGAAGSCVSFCGSP